MKLNCTYLSFNKALRRMTKLFEAFSRVSMLFESAWSFLKLSKEYQSFLKLFEERLSILSFLKFSFLIFSKQFQSHFQSFPQTSNLSSRNNQYFAFLTFQSSIINFTKTFNNFRNETQSIFIKHLAFKLTSFSKPFIG